MRTPSFRREESDGCRWGWTLWAVLLLAWGGLNGCSSDEKKVVAPPDGGPDPQSCLDCHGDADILEGLIPHDPEEGGESSEDG